MTRRSLFVLGFLLVFAAVSEAQPLPPKWWQRPEVVRELVLTRDQQEKLDDVFRAAANELIDIKAEAEKQQVALRGELDRRQLRRNEIRAIVAKLNEARGKLFEREVMMLVDMRALLSETQWEKLRMHFERIEDRKPGPPGGRRHPPP